MEPPMINLDDKLQEQQPLDPNFGIGVSIPALPAIYDETDSRVVTILNQAAEFCGKEFTEVPPDPDGTDNPDYDPNDPDNPENPPKEGGDIMPLAEDEEENKPQPGDPDFEIDPDDPDKKGQIDPDVPGEPYPDGTGEDPNPDLDDLRDKYKEALKKNLEEKQSYWAMLWQVIRLISDMACWTDTYNDTFIVQRRSQSVTVEKKVDCELKCGRCIDPIVIHLDYAPYGCELEDVGDDPANAKPFISGEIQYFDGEKFDNFYIPYDYLDKHFDRANQQLIILYQDFEELTRTKCECPEKVTVTIFYNAGYCRIPEALLPLVCQLMGKLEDSKKPLSDCTAALTQVSGLLRSLKNGNIQYQWSEKLQSDQQLFVDLYTVAMMAELNSISRCEIVNKVIAGEVV